MMDAVVDKTRKPLHSGITCAVLLALFAAMSYSAKRLQKIPYFG